MERIKIKILRWLFNIKDLESLNTIGENGKLVITLEVGKGNVYSQEQMQSMAYNVCSAFSGFDAEPTVLFVENGVKLKFSQIQDEPNG